MSVAKHRSRITPALRIDLRAIALERNTSAHMAMASAHIRIIYGNFVELYEMRSRWGSYTL